MGGFFNLPVQFDGHFSLGDSGMASQDHVFDTYARMDINFVRGEGIRLFDTEDRDFIDCASGIAVTSLGYAHPHLVETLKNNADSIWHLSNLYTIESQERLASRLCENTFADRVFFTNSGAEAVECGIKTARRYHYANGNAERVNILTFEGAFHGRTLATIAAGGQEKYLEGFGPKAPGFISLPFADEKALKEAVDDETAAILLEPVQGEGGIREFPATFLRFVRELCDKEDILLIYDEVQTGVGRSGKFFAHQIHKVEPDLMAIAKGLGGGFPVGACLAREEVAAAMVVGTHGSTFGGNPLAMEMGNAVLDVVLENGFLEHVNKIALSLKQGLAEIVDTYSDLVEEIRGTGLLLGLKAKVPNTDLVVAFRKHGLLSVGAGDNVIRFAPPLVTTEEDVREIIARVRTAFDDVLGQGASS